MLILLQLGGKNDGNVFADVNLDKRLLVMIQSAFINQGEVCLTTCIFDQEDVFNTFVDRYVQLAKSVLVHHTIYSTACTVLVMLTLLMIYYRNIKVGDSEDSNNMLGALNTKEHLVKVCLKLQPTLSVSTH